MQPTPEPQNRERELEAQVEHLEKLVKRYQGRYRGLWYSEAYQLGSKLIGILRPLKSPLRWLSRNYRMFRLWQHGWMPKRPVAASAERVDRATFGDKITFVTSLTENFVPGLITLLHSLQRYNPGFDFPFIVFVGDEFSQETQQRLLRVYPPIEFRKVNLENYRDIYHHDRLGLAAYFALESFSLTDQDKVIYLDSDQLCLGRIDPLLTATCDFGACLNVGFRDHPDIQHGTENYIFNTGMFIIGRKYLNEETRQALLALANSNHIPVDMRLAPYCDQRILNVFFGDKKIEIINSTYNCLKRLRTVYPFYGLKDLVLLHFVGHKPWMAQDNLPEGEQGYEDLNAVWQKHYEQATA